MQFPWYRRRSDRFDRVVLTTLIIEMCSRICVRALHARYPACRSAISVSLDCVKDDRASKFIPSLEIDVIHRGASGDIRRIHTTPDVIPFDEYNLSREVLSTKLINKLSNDKFQRVIMAASSSQLNCYLKKKYFYFLLF